MSREQLRNKEYFDKVVDFCARVIPKRQAGLAELDDPGKAGSTFDVWGYCIRSMVSRYSRGDVVASLLDSVKETLGVLELKRSTLAEIQLAGDVREMYERLDLSSLYESLTLLAFMVSLHFPGKENLQALQLIGHPGEDALLDQVAVALGDKSRVIAEECKFPNIYAPLLNVITSPAEQRAARLAKYVEGWYKRMRPIYWYENHRGGEGAYFGYWCFEAALVAMLYDIDDTALAEHPNYPADLVRNFRATA